MKLTHDEVKVLLPEYVGSSLSEEMTISVREHVKGCRACRAEITLLHEIAGADLPDPGEEFWKALPQKVRLSAGEVKTERTSLWTYLFRPAPVAAAVALAIVLVIVTAWTYRSGNRTNLIAEQYISESSTEMVMNCSGITEADMRQATLQELGEELAAEPSEFREYSYYQDIASMSPEEMERFYETLRKAEKGG